MKIFSLRFFSIAFACIFKLTFHIHSGEAAPTYKSHACTNSTSGGTLTPNSTYFSNLNLLLSYLTSNASLDGGFHQTIVAASTPDATTGLFLCRGDITTAICLECVADASREVLRRCSLEKQALIWYDTCLIRYQDRTGFSPNPGIVPGTDLASSQSMTAEIDRFERLLSGAMNSAAGRAMNSSSGKKFATDEEKFTNSVTLYSMAQCTPDLSTADCNTCLRSAIAFLPECCYGKQGGSVFLPSCIIRYESYRFYNTTTPSQALHSHPGTLNKQMLFQNH